MSFELRKQRDTMMCRSALQHDGYVNIVRLRLHSAIWYALIIASCATLVSAQGRAQSGVKADDNAAPQSVIIDTDIGGDIDDAYAVGLPLQSPELKILGITTEFGDTTLKARLVRRLLRTSEGEDVPVPVGISKHEPSANGLSGQARYAEGEPAGEKYPGAVDLILNQIRSHPDEITLITIGPLTNVGAAIDRDIATFRKLKRVVIMGGLIYRGYNLHNSYLIKNSRDPEFNIAADVPAAQKLFTSGVPLFVMPLDSTQIKLEELRQAEIFTDGTPLTDALILLTEQWSSGLQGVPTLCDATAVAHALDSDLCPTTPMNLRIDALGFTKVEQRAPNAHVCLRSDSNQFFDFFMPRILKSRIER